MFTQSVKQIKTVLDVVYRYRQYPFCAAKNCVDFS